MRCRGAAMVWPAERPGLKARSESRGFEHEQTQKSGRIRKRRETRQRNSQAEKRRTAREKTSICAQRRAHKKLTQP